MTRLTTLNLAFVLLASFTVAQAPPGVPGFNDYTISGLGSGTASCTTLVLAPGFHTLETSTTPGASVFIFASLFPCSPSPFYGCQGSQLYLRFPPVPLLVGSGTADAAGDFEIPVILPAALNFSTQAVIFDPSCLPLALFTQAYDVQT